MPRDWPAPTARIAALQRVVRAMRGLAQTAGPDELREMIDWLAGDAEATVEFCEAVGATDALSDALAQKRRDMLRVVPRG